MEEEDYGEYGTGSYSDSRPGFVNYPRMRAYSAQVYDVMVHFAGCWFIREIPSAFHPGKNNVAPTAL